MHYKIFHRFSFCKESNLIYFVKGYDILTTNNQIYIKDSYITLGQLLKLTNLFDSGGFIKMYINDEGVFVNEKLEYRRGRKLYENDVVTLKSGETFIVKSKTD